MEKQRKKDKIIYCGVTISEKEEIVGKKGEVIRCQEKGSVLNKTIHSNHRGDQKKKGRGV